MTTGDRSHEDDSYSEVADGQLDELEARTDPDLYNAVLLTCQFIFRLPTLAQSGSTAFTTKQGTVLCTPLAGHHPYKVFWSSDGPRIEAVFPRP